MLDSQNVCQNSILKQGRQKKVMIGMESVRIMQCENDYYSVWRAIFGILQLISLKLSIFVRISLSKISSFSIAIQDIFQKIICVMDIIFTFCNLS